jgi:hypothetical protein
MPGDTTKAVDKRGIQLEGFQYPLASEQLRSIWGWDSIVAGLNSVASGDPGSVASINTAKKIQEQQCLGHLGKLHPVLDSMGILNFFSLSRPLSVPCS